MLSKNAVAYDGKCSMLFSSIWYWSFSKIKWFVDPSLQHIMRSVYWHISLVQKQVSNYVTIRRNIDVPAYMNVIGIKRRKDVFHGAVAPRRSQMRVTNASTAQHPLPSSPTMTGLISSSLISGFSTEILTIFLMVSFIAVISDLAIPRAPDISL